LESYRRERRVWEVCGVEPELHTSRWARDKFGLAVTTGFFDPAQFEPDYFDFIMFDQVLEHVTEPRKFFSDALSILKSGGTLFVGVPPVDWLRLLLSKSKIERLQRFNVFIDPEEHINYFRLKTIRRIAEHCGSVLPGMHHSRKTRIVLSQICGLSTGAFFVQKPT
jgi:SAM-dependent methyltransferase